MPQLLQLAPILRRFASRPSLGRVSGFWVAALGIAFAGALLRLVWVQDIEYKSDEAGMFALVTALRESGTWPWLGFASSQNTQAHGMMAWPYLALDKVFHFDSPTELARASQCLNVLALVGLLLFARLCVPAGQRPTWTWAAALVACNPLLVLLQRKIWPVSITAPFLLLVLVGYWYRDRRWGALLWGAMVLVVGEMHAGGLFLAVGLAAYAFAFDRRRVRWGWWAAGSAATGALLIPWLMAIAGSTAAHPPSQMKKGNIATLNFYLRWVTEPFGLTLDYSLGKDFTDFLRYPLIGGQPTYLVAALHVATVLVIVAFLVSVLPRAWRERGRWKELLSGRTSPTTFAVNAVALGFGAVLTLSALPIHRHYMLIAFPMMQVWLAGLALADRRPTRLGLTRGQALLASLCLIQFALAACFLGYVHGSERTIRGDYGTPYAAQVRYGLPPK